MSDILKEARDKMIGIDYIIKTRDYLDYLEKHLTNVYIAYNELKDKCNSYIDDDLDAILRQEVSEHDLSKFSEDEFIQYRRHFFPTIDEVARGEDYKATEAFTHHEENNAHHWQNWLSDEYTEEEKIVHIVHMVIDWMAMGYEFGDNAKIFYENNKEKMSFPDKYEKVLYALFDCLYSGDD